MQLVRDKSERAEHIFLLYSKKSIKKRGHGMEVAIAASTPPTHPLIRSLCVKRGANNGRRIKGSFIRGPYKQLWFASSSVKIHPKKLVFSRLHFITDQFIAGNPKNENECSVISPARSSLRHVQLYTYHR